MTLTPVDLRKVHQKAKNPYWKEAAGNKITDPLNSMYMYYVSAHIKRDMLSQYTEEHLTQIVIKYLFL